MGEPTAQGQTKKYRVSTFIDKYIEEKMDDKKRKICLEIICGHLNNKLQTFKEEYVKDLKEIAELDATPDKAINQLFEKIKPYEQHIMYLVNQMFKIDEMNQDDNTESHRGEPQDKQSSNYAFDGKRKPGKSGHNRKKSRDAVHVSDMTKNARSTMKVKPNQGALLNQ